jgi:predicted TIM-barrel fold metal-dependent hydrolase
MQLTRRQWIQFAGIGACHALAGGRLRAQATSAASAGRIDVHQHFVSPAYLAMLTARNTTAPVPGLANWKGYSPASALAALDRVGVTTAMMSVTAPGVWFGNVQESRTLARELNEYGTASLVNAHKGRFGLFAALPLPDVEGSLREIEYAFDTLKVDGVGVLTSYGNQWLGDKAFGPVFDELNRRRAVVYVHPTDAACCPNLVQGVPAQMLEYPTDTTRTIVSLIVSGTASRTPDVRYVFSHAGGTLMAVAGRFLGAQANADALAKAPEPDSRLHHLRRFYYDTAGAANVVNMQALKTLVSVPQIVFGTDAPFFDGAPIVQGLRSSGFSAAEIQAIERDNALRLLPRLGRA